MAQEPVSSKPSRTPWLIAGVLGCLALFLCGALVGVSAFLIYGSGAGQVAKAQPTPTFVIPFPTSAPIVAPTPLSSLPTLLPTVTIQPTPSVSPTSPSALPPSITRQPTSTRPPVPPRVPMGKIAFSKSEGDRWEDQYVWIMNADGSDARMILERASDPSLSPDGTKIIFYRWKDGLFIANADGSNQRKLVGDARARYPEWSHDGTWVAFGAGNLDAVQPVLVGSELPTRRPIVTGGGAMPSWSPDDTQVVLQTCRENTCGLYRANSKGGDPILITGDDGSVPAWSPDGKKILYQRDVGGQRQLFLINPDGSGKRQLTSGAAMHVDGAWSLDGSYIFYRSPEGGTWGIWRMTAEGSGAVKLIDNVAPVDWAFEKLAIGK